VIDSGEVSVQLNFAAREVTLKLVYYGPALSGKTTNLRALHQLTNQESRGRLMTLETKDDRTLFFDMLPLVFRAEGAAEGGEANSKSGMSLRVKVFTVPGQVLHSSTRRLVLQGADGVAFIADSQVRETEANAASFIDLRDNLHELGVSIQEMPLIIQFNKRDLAGVRPDEELEELARRGKEPVFKASAVAGRGVLESFFGLLQLSWNKLDHEHQLGKNIGIEGSRFLPIIATKLGFKGDVRSLLSASVGGTFAKAIEGPP
jgi:mutual gliding-motility protein MglA